MAGHVPYPQVRLNPELRDAAQRAMRDGRPSGPVMALRAGFSHQAIFSKQLNAETLAASPITFQRFTRLAELLGFTGEVFLADVDAFSEVPDSPVEVAHVE